jgi:hypothetical protein
MYTDFWRHGVKKQKMSCVRYEIDGESHILLVVCCDIACGEKLYILWLIWNPEIIILAHRQVRWTIWSLLFSPDQRGWDLPFPRPARMELFCSWLTRPNTSWDFIFGIRMMRPDTFARDWRGSSTSHLCLWYSEITHFYMETATITTIA